MSAIIKEERIGGQRLILGDCTPEAPYMEAPFDWAETQGDLAPIIREVERRLFYVALFMAGWFTGTVMCALVAGGVL